MRESRIERRLVRLCSEHRVLTYKFTGVEAGVPDRIVICKGKTYFVEVKQEEGEVSKIQKWQHARLVSAGVEVWVLWTVKAVEAFIEGLE